MICRACGRTYGLDIDETGNPQVTAKHHSRTKGATGKKEGDMDLCHHCHTEWHIVGRKSFIKRHPEIVFYYPELGDLTK